VIFGSEEHDVSSEVWREAVVETEAELDLGLIHRATLDSIGSVGNAHAGEGFTVCVVMMCMNRHIEPLDCFEKIIIREVL